MAWWSVTLEYKVVTPERGSAEWDDVVRGMIEDGCWDSNETVEDLTHGGETLEVTEDEMAYYLIEKSHVGDYTESVELVYDAIDPAPTN
jgi:hypothetical protein